MANIYTGTDPSKIRSNGVPLKVTLSGGVAQGNDGTSLPCAGCYVQAASANTAVVKMSWGTDATANLGIELGRPFDGTDEGAACQPMFVPIDDVANLYFFSTDTDAIVDILYLK